MSQTNPTRDELVTEEMMLTQGLRDDDAWKDEVHSMIFPDGDIVKIEYRDESGRSVTSYVPPF